MTSNFPVLTSFESFNTLVQDGLFNPELSGAIQSVISETNLNTILSALNALSGIALSSTPTHPYDSLKMNIYGPEYKDYVFKTLEDIPNPVDFVPEQALKQLLETNSKLNEKVLAGFDSSTGHFVNTALNTVSGDVVTPDIDAHKRHIEFIELIRQIPIENLSDEKVIEYSRKLISEYIRSY